jgi:hypothetical protein
MLKLNILVSSSARPFAVVIKAFALLVIYYLCLGLRRETSRNLQAEYFVHWTEDKP